MRCENTENALNQGKRLIGSKTIQEGGTFLLIFVA